MSKRKWTDEQKRAWSEKCKAGANKRILSAETIERLKIISKQNNIAYWTEERRAEQSARMKEKVQEKPDSYSKSNVSGRAKLYEVSDSMGLTKVKGTWELKVATYLNDNKIKWTNNIEPIKYIWEGKWHLYFPDFLLLDSNILIEVKGYETERDKAKWAAVDKKLIIIRKKDIDSLNAIIAG